MPRQKQVNFRPRKIGNNVRYVDEISGVEISRYRYRQFKKQQVEIHTTSRTTHRTFHTDLEFLSEDVSRHKSGSFSVFMRWINEDGKTVQTPMVSTKNRSGSAIAADLYEFATAKNRKAKSRLPFKTPEDDEQEPEEEYNFPVELVFVSRI